MRFAVNPLQFYAGLDGMLDFSAGPPYHDVLRACQAAGFRAVQAELGPAVGAMAYAAMLRAPRLAAAPAYFSAPLVSEDQHAKIAADFRAAVAMSRDLGLDRIVVADNVTRDRFLTAGRHTDNPAPQAALASAATVLERLGRIGQEAGVAASLHPHVGSHIESPLEIASILAETSPELVQLCPDTGHLAWGGCDDVIGFLR